MTHARPLVALSLLFGATMAFAQTSGTCAAPISASLGQETALTINSQSGEIDLVGSDQDGIRISCTVKDPDKAQDVRIRFMPTGMFGKLTITGGSTHNMHVRIELPRHTGIKLHMPAGEVKVDQLIGDKDIEIHAGEIRISGVSPSDYNRVEASVKIGDVKSSVFRTEKGGFFRSISKTNPEGRYRLRASVGTGSVQIN